MRKRLNLNPKSIEKEKKKDGTIIYAIIYCVLAALLLLNVAIIYFENISLKDESAKLSSSVKGYKIDHQEYIDTYNELQREKTFVNKINEINKKGEVWKDIRDIGNYVPSGISIDSMQFDNGKIVLQGISKTNSEVAVFLANLQMSNKYKNASVLNMGDTKIIDGNLNINQKDDNKKDSKDKNDKSKDNKNNNSKIDTKNAVQFTIEIEGEGENEKN
ncbi:PilN domain-containing protein [Clostridium baratii]|uniref:Fimbrial assembly protein (PilN) n=1 Tax=Clostridium baratii TaxID=1561 RepID=A0A174RGA2_9CLOT|nr:PilN domain-containing protein [Clostridium baratii]CUP82867.1 Fimbrial assembly protein (PilN) [Clostridium baratii]